MYHHQNNLNGTSTKSTSVSRSRFAMLGLFVSIVTLEPIDAFLKNAYKGALD